MMRRTVMYTLMVMALVAYAPPTEAEVLHDHLQCFKIKKDDLQQFKATAIVDLASGISRTGCKVKVRGKLYCIPAEKTLVDSGGAPVVPFAGGEVPNDYICYRMKCGKRDGGAVMTDQFGTRWVEFKNEKMLCAPAQQE